ncbi:hypothetical protein FMUND_12927 [Fusarium mundagurra]|uniref:Uncharacterized protein n=1 Tax=Fusarium mundagurra TaxID=1567541 RepID=A0A8H6D4U0_9HYPO|nr:hypothetical protein FMUND_12927 [Fusarium mundagurra]
MAKSKSKSKSKTEASSETDAASTEPTPRPVSTCGSEHLLMTTRLQASEQYAKAAKAEKAYRTKKRAAIARANYNETKTHFKEAFSHLWLAFKGVFPAIKNSRYLLGERRDKRRQEAEKKKRERNLERKKKLEEQLAREEAEAQDDGKKEEDKTEE